jgi:hypothetical protein
MQPVDRNQWTGPSAVLPAQAAAHQEGAAWITKPGELMADLEEQGAELICSRPIQCFTHQFKEKLQ